MFKLFQVGRGYSQTIATSYEMHNRTIENSLVPKEEYHSYKDSQNIRSKVNGVERWRKVEIVGFGGPRPLFQFFNTILFPITTFFSKVTVPKDHQALVYYWRMGQHLPCFKVAEEGTYTFNPVGRKVRLIDMRPQKTEFVLDTSHFDRRIQVRAKVTWQVTDSEGVFPVHDIPKKLKNELAMALENVFLEDPAILSLVPNENLNRSVQEEIAQHCSWCSIKIYGVEISKI